MTDSSETAPKVHYICQTYVAKTGKGAGGASLQIGKQFEYTSASPTQERAERESRSEACVGADAYMVIEDQESGEISLPTFLARFGSVPEIDAF